MTGPARGMRMHPATPQRAPRPPALRPRFFLSPGAGATRLSERGSRANDDSMNDGRTDFNVIDCR